ncbi:DUF1800 domain-containing protein [Hymenobacter gummosus]|uniref:DUF1800 domain-containing protein n=1 Tax=Hymenobacter gummosus TaxID=1776032 RepID=A0A431TYY8_9BACT|nr:DUF1800 domain-containing protein [Hymenobacter gummosus]RTQ47216.1 DUF1800 domain-containing protein [Hymenobacter gummosus]
MDRRAFLRKPASVLTAPAAALTDTAAYTDPPGQETVSRFANQTLPDVPRTNASLAPYAGTWGPVQAAHLLRRCVFGPTRAQLAAAAGSSLTQVLNGLLTAPAAPAPPVNVSATDTSVAIGQTWTAQAFDQNFEGVRRSSLRAWWLGQLLSDSTLQAKMWLFWHNHFVIELADVGDARYGYQYAELLRSQALGNVKQLCKDVTVAPAMLRYLNGNQSTATAPNENYGRELLELFTVGKGPIIGPGNYTTYTEADVQAAARVLTGWRDNSTTIQGYYTASRHDTTTKQFSGAFQNQSIPNGGATEYQTLVDMIFGQAETARYLVRKLYRWFVYYVIDATTEQQVIQPLAAQLQQNGYNLAPVLRTLLASEHFFDAVNVGCYIKSPLEFSLGLLRQMEVAQPTSSNVAQQYAVWDYYNGLTNLQQQYLGDPPNVAGWPAYWQTPQFNELWINAVTLPRRNQVSDALLTTTGVTRSGFQLIIDPVAWAQSLPVQTSQDPNLLIRAFVDVLMPFPLTTNQLAFLNDALLPGLPDFEWTDEWTQYLAAPTNTAKKNAVATKLRALLRVMLSQAEFQLS